MSNASNSTVSNLWFISLHPHYTHQNSHYFTLDSSLSYKHMSTLWGLAQQNEIHCSTKSEYHYAIVKVANCDGISLWQPYRNKNILQSIFNTLYDKLAIYWKMQQLQSTTVNREWHGESSISPTYRMSQLSGGKYVKLF